MQLIDEKQKIVIFDSNVYIGLKDNADHRQLIFDSEKCLSIQPYASPWVILELAQYLGDSIALDVLKEHCKGDDGLIRVIPDLMAQIYYSIYDEESRQLKRQLDEVIILLGLDAIQREHSNVKDALKKASDFFVNQFKTLPNALLEKENAIKRKCAEDVIDMCIEINKYESKVKINRAKVVEQFIQKNHVPLEHYYQLLKRKATQQKVNKEELRHDQRDWTIVFYASQSNNYVVTNENNLLDLNLPNLVSLEQYMRSVLKI